MIAQTRFCILALTLNAGVVVVASPSTDSPASSSDTNSQTAIAERREVESLTAELRGRVARLPRAEALLATLEGLRSAIPLDTTLWMLVIESAESLSKEDRYSVAYRIQHQCRNRELISDLKLLVSNSRLTADRPAQDIRSAAIVALHDMGQDCFKEMLVEDIISPTPQFTSMAHATLGDYKAAEIGQGLLRLLTAKPHKVRRDAAERLRDFGGAVPAHELRTWLKRSMDENPYFQAPLLEALSLKSPEDAFPFVRDIVFDPRWDRNLLRFRALRLLCRMDFPAARELVQHLLDAEGIADKPDLIGELAWSWVEGTPGYFCPEPEPALRDPERKFPPAPRVSGYFFHDLLRLFQSDASAAIRVAAGRAMSRITCVPPSYNTDLGVAEFEECLPKWDKWWEVNRHRFVQSDGGELK